ncbi:MAG: hypothetical protein Ct9H300mP28_08850 [Pseudomonadota bacterium]|nr:MAG: hypothetical protein Ct9H300mP28_08850 [Pseudomonadota bacterium]
MALTIESRINLNDGVSMPLFGIGVRMDPEGKTREAVTLALELGYIHIDTASMYKNEEDVGAQSGDTCRGKFIYYFKSPYK